MKLYTEEQVKRLLKDKTYLREDTIKSMLNNLKSIKLPSDEDIEFAYYSQLEERKQIAKNFKGQVSGRHPDMFGHNEVHHMARGYLECVQWIRDQIKQQSNG